MPKPLLYDMLTRHQIFLEGVKVFGAKKFNEKLKALQGKLQTLILSIPHETMGDLSRKEINSLLAKMLKASKQIMNEQEQETTDFLFAVMAADLELSREIFAIDKPKPKTFEPEPITAATVPKSQKRMWANITDEPLPSDGSLLPLLIIAFSAGVSANIIKQIRMAIANKDKPKTLYSAIVGTSGKKFSDGVFAKFYRDNSAIMATGIQHVSSIVQATLASFIYEEYEWVSVIDSATTDICLERDGNVYKYGQGPLPPAHYNCRSKTVPVSEVRAPSNQTYFGWLKTQPNTVLDEIMSVRDATRFRAGDLKKNDLPKFKDAKPLSIPQFRAKLKTITAA